jgi:hypothetical protein
MKKIVRSAGTTPSERYLAKLADRTFLNLWSYPNLFIDKKDGGKGNGKELCDLLVVCGDDIIIFSDKSIEWPTGVDYKIGWPRWYRRAVDKSVAQIRGAERWLREFPSRIFLDAECTERFPLGLPPLERRCVHGVIVAMGVSDACRKFYGDSSGTFPIAPSVKGTAHVSQDPRDAPPFGIGDVNPDGAFVHVFNDEALDILMRERDTVTDFVRYLTRRERFIRSGHLGLATGEEDLLAYYLQHGSGDGHDFVPSDGKAWKQGEVVAILGGEYDRLIRHPSYLAKKEADEVSYVWDHLVNEFTDNILAGTSVVVAGEEPDAARAEVALRSMALERRVNRRLLGQSVADAMVKAEREKHDRFCRVLMPGPLSADSDVIYVFLILAYPKHLELKGGYEQYRTARVHMLHAYCLDALSKNRETRRAVGIAIDASSRVTGRKGGSEDILALEVKEWTPELEEDLRAVREKFDIMRPERIRRGEASVEEYPTPARPPLPSGLNRRQRRAMQSARRKTDTKRELSPLFHPPMRRVLASFEPCWLGGATGRGAEPSM